MDDENNEDKLTKAHSKGYGKRSIWWWVVIYIVAAIIVYGIIYLVFFNKTGDSGFPRY